MSRYVCIHGHFYQPPRENPWLETVEVQDSAYPFHDWNERIAAECYGPNAAARILDGEGRIERIVNNYARISFNFGPTLLSWMAAKAPAIYRAVLAADRESRERFSGHGSALAQAYHHSILPLANRRDKRTEIRWGLADFAHRFGRPAEGFWLPETAVDTESLEILAEEGVRFTLLEPRQARRFRPLAGDEDAWREVPEGIDGRVPYRLHLPSGRTLDLFFYNGAISRAIAFEGLLASGEMLTGRLLGAFSPPTHRSARERAELVHIATDGETYGHHHRFGDMALAYALRRIEEDAAVTLTNYGEFLERHPPEFAVEIRDDTSWSCAHGIERWRSDCGCSTGASAGWNQAWRSPLRAALDALRDEIAPLYEAAAAPLLADPWAARDAYVEVLFDRAPERISAFLTRHGRREGWNEAERTRALKLLELERQALLMYTSCGWFFNDLAGIETVQVLRYAGRAVQLARELFGDGVEERFLARLEAARSNLSEEGDGRRIYERHVRPVFVGLPQVAAHYAVTSIFEEIPRRAPIYCYAVEREEDRRFAAGRTRLSFGRLRVTSEVTGEWARLSFAVLHLGDHNVNAAVRESGRADGETEAYERLVEAAGQALERADFPQVVRLLDRHFGAVPYSLKSLFRDEQRRLLDHILATTRGEVEAELRQLYYRHRPLMRFLADLETPQPEAFRAPATLVINADLRRALADPAVDLAAVHRLLAEAWLLGLELDAAGLRHELGKALAGRMEQLRRCPDEPDLLERLEGVAALAVSPPFGADLWSAQNVYHELLAILYTERQARAAAGDAAAAAWTERFRALGERLRMRVE
jgi:alpha-amylase/alpha-mannosidase (GH57 family)